MRPRHRWTVPLAAAATGLLHCAFVLAAPEGTGGSWRLCATAPWLPQRPFAEERPEAPEAIQLNADKADLIKKGVSLLTGNVQVLRGQQQLQAERVQYDEGRALLDVTGAVRFWDQGLYLSGERGRLELPTKLTRIEHARFRLEAEHVRGEADGITVSSRDDVLWAEQGSYTTCDDGNVDWALHGKNIKLNRRTQNGTAWNVTIRLKGVPVFYSPFLTFPLTDKRKSGFLPPRFGSSGQTGFEFLIPYYWNIASNQDATFTVRGMTRRGALLAGEYRFLTRNSNGEIGLEYLPYDIRRTKPRGALSTRARWNPSRRWGTEINVTQVSDDDYLQDLGTGLEFSSVQFLERRGDLLYSGNGWSALGRVQSYQTVDRNVAPESRPYSRLPQLLISSTLPERNRRLNPRFNGELVNFQREQGITGTRVDLQPSVSFPLRTAALFLIPRANLRYTAYHLFNSAPEQPADPDRLLPTLSLDGGLFFERSWALGTDSLIQTLEPRLYYLFVPFEDQTNLPVFDTGEFTFGLDQLFRDNRFSGPDRMGDANQLTLALTSRLFSPSTGRELLRASLGQIRFFRDRKVTLPEQSPGIGPDSDIIADINAQVARQWQLSAGLQWDTEEASTRRRAIGLRYQPDRERVINLSYRFRRGIVEQTDVSFRWPIKRNWGVIGRWTYAINNDTTVDAFAGFEYEGCCLAVRAIGRRYLVNSNGDFSNGVFLQLQLKGLGGLGAETAAFLKTSIPGYEPLF